MSKPPSELQLRWVAHHEAAHAVVAAYFGFEVERIYADPTRYDGGMVRPESRDGRYEDYLVVLAAGGRGEERFLMDAGHPATLRERVMLGTDRHDWDEIRRIARNELGIPDDDLAGFEIDLTAHAFGLVQDPEIWGAIEELAARMGRHNWELSAPPLQEVLARAPRHRVE
jgi:hypothetical protein